MLTIFCDIVVFVNQLIEKKFQFSIKFIQNFNNFFVNIKQIANYEKSEITFSKVFLTGKYLS